MANNTENHTALETNESSRETGEPSGTEHLERGENHKVWETNESTRCPFTGGAVSFTTSTRRSNKDWWPNALDLKILRQHSSLS
jgi:catalase-peroxidase